MDRWSNLERDPHAQLRIAHGDDADHSQALPSPPHRRLDVYRQKVSPLAARLPPIAALSLTKSVVTGENGKGGVPAAQPRRTDLAADELTTTISHRGARMLWTLQSSRTASDQHHPASSRAMAGFASAGR